MNCLGFVSLEFQPVDAHGQGKVVCTAGFRIHASEVWRYVPVFGCGLEGCSCQIRVSVSVLGGESGVQLSCQTSFFLAPVDSSRFCLPNISLPKNSGVDRDPFFRVAMRLAGAVLAALSVLLLVKVAKWPFFFCQH